MNDNGTVCIMLSAIIKDHRFEMYMLYTFQIYGKDERCLRSIYTWLWHCNPFIGWSAMVTRSGTVKIKKKFLKNISVEQICPWLIAYLFNRFHAPFCVIKRPQLITYVLNPFLSVCNIKSISIQQISRSAPCDNIPFEQISSSVPFCIEYKGPCTNSISIQQFSSSVPCNKEAQTNNVSV
jgi:hypothetical protein